MKGRLPQGSGEFLDAGRAFQSRVRSLKAETTVQDYGWYPYEPLTALPLITELIQPVYEEIVEACAANPVVDLGCADGDLAMFLAEFGLEVDAIDHQETNFNQMRGVETLRNLLKLDVRTYDVDLDQPFELQRSYGVAFFLGTLYHLKNPFYVLEQLAKVADWCLVSTRIAQVTPGRRAHIEAEPVAYLLAAREINNDPTNFWIFSAAGFARLIERAGWILVNERRVGCRVDSDPVNPEADERIFTLLKSRTRHPELHVRKIEGWYAPENEAWCWTAKRFAVQVLLPKFESASEFALRFAVPDVILSATKSLRVRCTIGGALVGSITCDTPGATEFRGRFPETTDRDLPLDLEFLVDSSFHGSPEDSRDLGIIIPLLDASHRNTERIPFRIS